LFSKKIVEPGKPALLGCGISSSNFIQDHQPRPKNASKHRLTYFLGATHGKHQVSPCSRLFEICAIRLFLGLIDSAAGPVSLVCLNTVIATVRGWSEREFAPKSVGGANDREFRQPKT